MKVRNGFLFALAVLMTFPLAYFVTDRIDFVRSSKKTPGTVQDVRAHNDRCGGRKRRYDCTKFTATLRYNVDEGTYQIDVSAGSVRGHDRPISAADHRFHEQVQVAYDSRQPSRAYRDTLWDIWGAPLITFFVQICMLFGGFTEKRRDT